MFVFQTDDPQQNGVKLLTPVSDLVFNALSDGTIHFALYGKAMKTESETGVKSDTPFCLQLPIKKTVFRMEGRPGNTYVS